MFLRNRSHGLLALAAMCFLMPDGGGSGGGMSQPTPAEKPVEGSGTLETEEKAFADDDYSPAAMKWRKEQGKTSTLPTSTTTEPEGGGATALSAAIPQGVEPDEEDIVGKRDDLTPAPREFDHLTGQEPHYDEEEFLKANGRGHEFTQQREQES